MKLFVINLDRAPERLERMSRLFGEFGLEFTRIAATDGRTLTKEELERWRKGGTGRRELAAGETACFLSHRECWQRVIDEDLPFAAIFEDDLHFGSDAASLLGDQAWIPKNADVVKIETKLYPTTVDKSPALDVGGRILYRLRGKHAGAGGYIVSRKGAENLLRMSEALADPVDQFIFNPALPSAASLAVFQLSPAICMQDFVVKDRRTVLGLGSDLHGERAERKPRGAAKLWREIKRPAVQIGGFVGRRLSSLLTDRKWIIVPFE